MKPNVNGYLASWSEELLSRANRVRFLIGDAHWLSDGHHKESLLREFLARHLPPGLLINRGFVRGADDSERCSPENDILLSDPVKCAPLFNEGDLIIVAPRTVVGFIEAKTTLTKPKVLEAVASQIATIRSIETYVANAPNQIWRGIVFASTKDSTTLGTCLKTIKSSIATLYKADSTFETKHLPKCIATYDRFLFFLSPVNTFTYRIRGFSIGSLSIACFVNDLFVTIQEDSGPLQDIINRISAEHLSEDADIRDAQSEKDECHD